MKRDMDLIRWLLLQLEARESFDRVRTEELFPELETPVDYTEKQIEYHVRLLIEAGLVAGTIKEGTRSNPWHVWVERLSWEGHEFLEAARDETRWNQVKRWLVERSGGLAYSILLPLLMQKAKEQLGIVE